jgi:hypothetical protein
MGPFRSRIALAISMGEDVMRRSTQTLRPLRGNSMTFTQRMAGTAALGAALLGSSLIPSPAQAGYVVTLSEVGNDVVATGSGPIDLTGMFLTSSGGDGQAFMLPASGSIVTGPAVQNIEDSYAPTSEEFVGPTSFGSGFILSVVNGSGDIVGIIPSIGELLVPEGYVSGAPLKDIAIYNGQSFSSLGVTPGTYVWSWGDGGANQNFTLVIPALGSALIPEPASAALLGTALAGLLLTGKLRHA